MTALKQMGEHDLKELGIPMVYIYIFFYSFLSMASFSILLFVVFFFWV